MAANTSPIYARTPHIGWGDAMTAANTAKDGASGTIYTVFTADATEGSVLEALVFRSLGTNVATVARIFVNNGSSTGTAANNSLLGEITLNATTVSEVAAQPEYVWLPPNGPLRLPANYVIFCTIGTAVSAGWKPTALAGKY